MIKKILNNPTLWNLSRYFLDITWGLYRKRIAFLQDLGIFSDNPSVLDIGCGIGLFADITKGHYVGIDSNYQVINCANKREVVSGILKRMLRRLSVLRRCSIIMVVSINNSEDSTC